MRQILSTLLAILAIAQVGLAESAECTSQSPSHRQGLIELYTSEGCSSCPPAERWLGQDFHQADSKTVALAFHVVYWDYLGWKDKWAKPEFTERQKSLSARQGLRSIYTPGIFLAGKEWRAWGTPQGARDLDRLQTQNAPVVLRLEQDSANGKVTAKARALTQSPTNHWELYLASTIPAFKSKVNAGENRGETLQHAHVVRQLAGPFSLASGAKLQLSAEDETVVAFVQDRQSGEVVQAIKAKAQFAGNACL